MLSSYKTPHSKKRAMTQQLVNFVIYSILGLFMGIVMMIGVFG